MDLWSIFGSKKKSQQGSVEEGKKLYELGIIYASQYKSNEAIDCYSRSIDANKDPAPYVNRAYILAKRDRYFEALQDLLEAKKLEKARGNYFDAHIDRELALTTGITENYRNGNREKLISDLKSNDIRYVSERVLCSNFDISPSNWRFNGFNREMIEHHYFNEIDDIAKFDEREKFDFTADLITAYPQDFIQMKLDSFPMTEKYREHEFRFHSMICCYDISDTRKIRDYILFAIHGKLMELDYGPLWASLASDCEGVTKEAAEFIILNSNP